MLTEHSFNKLNQLISSVFGNVFWKDSKHKYLGGNNNLIALPTLIKIQKNEDIVGKTVHELLPAELADPIFQNDQLLSKML